jgi:hypothetical protein
MRLAQVSNRLANLAENCEVTGHLTDASQKLGQVSEKVYDQMSAAREVARRGAQHAYRVALENPRTSAAAGAILAAALIGGVLWYVFGDWRKPAPRKRVGARVRAGAERRKRARQARAAA